MRVGLALFWLRRLLHNRNGSVITLGALSLVSVLGMSGLAVEIGNGYTAKVRNQRVADLAALGGALAFSKAPSANAYAVAEQVVYDIVVANGLPANSDTVQISQVTVGSGTGIKVQITTPVPIKIASVLTNAAKYDVANSAVASLVSTASPGCFQALSSAVTYGISLTGGTSLTALGCAVQTNSGISATAGTHITASSVAAGKTINDPAAAWLLPGIITLPTLNNIKSNQGTVVVDTVGADPRVVAGFAKVGSFTPPVANTNPVTPGTQDWSFPNSEYAYTQLPASDPIKANCTYAASIFTCKTGTYDIRALTIPGGMSVVFQGASNITIANGINNGGNGLAFGGGNLKVNGNITTGWGVTNWGNTNLTFGSGTLTFQGTNLFGNGNIVMNNVLNLSGGGTLTMGNGYHSFNGIAMGGGARLTLGAGNLNVNGAITIDGGSIMTVGAGDYAIGKSGSTSISIGGGSILTFGDGAFSTSGGITTSGGTTITFGATASHYINGDLSLTGNATFGAGAYYVNGNFSNNTGGTMLGANVTFFTAGTLALSGGTLMVLSAPTSDTGGGVTDLLFATKSSAQTRIGGGSLNSYSGMVYAPNSDMIMDGGAGAAGVGRCFSLLVNTLSLNGGAAAGSACLGLGGGGTTGTVALIQ